MFITFGTRFYGKIGEYNGQWIETKFFNIMFIPLYPIESYFVTHSEFNKRAGFRMETYSKSMTAAYCRLLFFIVGAVFGFLCLTSYDSYHYEGVLMPIIFTICFLASATLWVYFCFFYGAATDADKAMRDKVWSITGYYAMPHWFEYYQLTGSLAAFQKKYYELYPGEDWKADLNSINVSPEKYKLLFGLALFNCMVNNEPANDELYAKADSLYQVAPKN